MSTIVVEYCDVSDVACMESFYNSYYVGIVILSVCFYNYIIMKNIKIIIIIQFKLFI